MTEKLVDVDTGGMDGMVASYISTVTISASRAIDLTLSRIVDAEKNAMIRNFANPVPFTMGGVKRITTEKRNMIGSVFLAHPPRMSRTYLAPEVEGGERKMKGFERALRDKIGTGFFKASKVAPTDQYGNITGGKITQMLTVLKAGNSKAALAQAITAKSKVKNTKPRAYFYLAARNDKKGGIFERYGVGGRKMRRFMTEIGTPKYKKLLPFYEIARQTTMKYFPGYFAEELRKEVANKGWRK